MSTTLKSVSGSVAILLGLSSCGVFGSEVSLDELSGWWCWERTHGGFAGVTIHSDSVDYTQRLYVPGGAFAFRYHDDDLVQVYRVIRSSEIDDGGVLLEATKKSGLWRMDKHVSSTETHLILRDTCTDCFTEYYHRITEE